jgi:hypothetical protein
MSQSYKYAVVCASKIQYNNFITESLSEKHFDMIGSDGRCTDLISMDTQEQKIYSTTILDLQVM